MAGFVLGGRWVVADRFRRFPMRTKGEVLPGVLLVGPGAAGEQTVRLEPQELCPGRPDATGAGPRPARRSTVATVVAETSIPSSRKLPPDPGVAPARVLPPQAKDQVFDRGIERGTAGPARGAVAPA